MVNFQENFYARRAGDGQNRAHLPAMPMWTAFVRVAQLVLAFLLVILTGYAASKLGSGAAGFGLTWWAFIWTLLYFVWLGFSTLFNTVAYHYWGHLVAESLAVLWWLCAWAVLASDASAWAAFQGYYDGDGYDYDIPGYGNYGDYISSINTAINVIKAAAGLGALEWLLFVVTLVFFVLSLLAYRRAEAGAVGTTGTEAAPQLADTKPAPATEMTAIHETPRPA